ncbi:MAG TPA: hypothetical protein VFZ25_03930 [Chloroflexota bacterium]|nr:hypothetical protein [Chloroflexota bacterium]
MNAEVSANRGKITGRLLVTVRSADGGLVAERRAANMVLRNGAVIIAKLFSGAAGVTPINQIQVGFATDSGTAELTALTPPDPALPVAALRGPVKAEDFHLATDQPGEIQVSISTVFHPTQDLPDVTEAGLLAGEDLYNHVVFEPLTLKTGQDITFFWQVNFPFGH